jgi:hypothetical protein
MCEWVCVPPRAPCAGPVCHVVFCFPPWPAGKDTMWTHYLGVDYDRWLVVWWIFAVPTLFVALHFVYLTSFYRHAIVDHVHYIGQVKAHRGVRVMSACVSCRVD